MSRLFVFTLFVVTCCCPKKNKQTASVNQKVKQALRYGMVTGIKSDKIQFYKELHAMPWPQVLEKIKECNIRNYSIYFQKIQDHYYLFSYFEYTGNNFNYDMKKMAKDSVTQRWWKETDPCQLPLEDALKRHQIWTSMQEVFHFE